MLRALQAGVPYVLESLIARGYPSGVLVARKIETLAVQAHFLYPAFSFLPLSLHAQLEVLTALLSALYRLLLLSRKTLLRGCKLFLTVYSGNVIVFGAD